MALYLDLTKQERHRILLGFYGNLWAGDLVQNRSEHGNDSSGFGV